MEKKMKLDSVAVHAGDRKKSPDFIPSTTPIHLSSSYFYETTEQLDKVFAQEIAGESYARYGNPTNNNLEELITALEGGAGTLVCSSGMSALQVAISAAITDRRKSIVAAGALYGATLSLLMKVFEPMGVEVTLVDICDLDALKNAVETQRPGCVVMETISNPLMRVAQMDKVAEIARAAGAALVVDNTFATPLLVQPLSLGAHMTVHSLTKYLAGHGDVLGGSITCDDDHLPIVRGLSRIYGPVLGPFESYLTMRGVKTFPLRMERQCKNACQVASWLASHPGVDRVNFPSDPKHPDAAAIQRILPKGLYGAMLSFELKDAGREQVFAWMDRLQMIVRATSLGDVHTMVLYPAMSSHREVSPKQRERLGIKDNLVRISVGIEAAEDILADLERAFAS